MLTALMASTWVALEVARAMKSSVPVNCPWGSARSCRVAPIHFRPPIGGPVSSLHVHAPLTVPRRPPAKGPACSVVKAAIPVNRRGARTLQSWAPPSTFGCHLRPGFEPRALEITYFQWRYLTLIWMVWGINDSLNIKQKQLTMAWSKNIFFS